MGFASDRRPALVALWDLEAYLACSAGDYWAFHVRQDQERLHPQGSGRVVEK